MTNNSQYYYNSVVKIYRHPSAPSRADQFPHVGAGMIVDSTTIITCAHVVAQALGLSGDAKRNELPDDVILPVQRVFVNGFESDTQNARLHLYYDRKHSDALADVAVLKLTEGEFNLQRGITHEIAAFSIVSDINNQSLAACGFPKDVFNSVAKYAPAYYKLKEAMPNDWLHAVSDETTGQEIRFGFSGAPIRDLETGNIIGIVCEADQQRRTANIISIKQLKAIYPIKTSLTDENVVADKPEIIRHAMLTQPRLRILPDSLVPRLHFYLSVTLQLLKDPAERQDLQDYLRHNKANWSDDVKDKTYLPPPAKSLENSSIQLQKLDNPFQHPVQQLIKEIAGISSGGDASSAQISALSKRSKRVQNLVRTLLRSKKPLIVLGEPGSGKSLTLKQVAIELCRINEKKVFPAICVFIQLGRWTPVKKPGIEHVEKLVSDNIRPELKPYLQALIQQKRLIVIFDGLDEMSREEYVLHTEALSKYADKYEGQVHTLFSCRIADFSPAFKHHRLVLMPFERRQIRSYLEQQLGRSKLNISNEEIAIPQLAKRLLTDNLPIQPKNPFSLWLLCLFIREKKAWPESRVELLQFSFEFQYDRKKEESDNDTDNFPLVSELFYNWGKLAFEITQLNKGTDIGLHEVRGLLGADAINLINLGRNCGVLQQTTEHDPILIRFVHHRAQEFFTAWYLVHANVQVPWSNYIDIPRWQETLIFVSQMKGGIMPLRELQESLENAVKELKGMTKKDKLAYTLKEAMTAERVELSSRVAKVIPSNEDGTLFLETFKKTVLWLAKKGGPVSQVKMLQVAQALPQLALFEVVKLMLASKISWVRENAQVVAANFSDISTAGTIADDTINAYGDGSILRTLPARLSLTKKIRSTKGYFINIMAALLFLVQSMGMACIFPILAKYSARPIVALTYKKLPAKTNLQQWFNARLPLNEFFITWMPLVVLGVAVLLLIYTLILRAKDSWWLPFGGSGISYVLTVVIYYLWTQSSHITLPSLIKNIFVLLCFSYILLTFSRLLVVICSSVIWSITTGIMALLVYSWTRNKKDISNTFRICWAKNGYSEVASAPLTLVLVMLIGGLVMGLTIYGLEKSKKWLIKIIPDLPYTPFYFDVLFTLAFFVGVCGLACAFFPFFRKRKYNKKVLEFSLYLLGFASIYYLFFIAYVYVEKLINYLLKQLPDVPVSNVILIIIILLVVILIGCIFYLLFRICKHIIMKMAAQIKAPASETEFRMSLRTYNPIEQEVLLTLATPQGMQMTADDFFKLLTDVEGIIKEEPALSKYWSKRAEIQELIRTGRTG